ncbi:hypothetical protein F5Y04DRAFT_275965 [Hypomontagnella monticulosa]|nr:hypothetical protein F5Y04DRAFT_275965 [Hypomontagnella monticulosa]
MGSGRKSPPPPYAPADNLPTSLPPYMATRVSADESMPIYLKAYFDHYPFSRVFHLGESSKNPLYTVSARESKSSTVLLTLHKGSSRKGPIIASMELPPRAHSLYEGSIDVPPQISGSGSGEDKKGSGSVFVKHYSDWREAKHVFKMKVGVGKNTWTEEFEWRRSHGPEVQDIDRDQKGYKLVRLGGAKAGSISGDGGPRVWRQKGEASDGREVVAAFAASQAVLNTKVFKFKRMRSGATGELGTHFAIVALTSALKIWCIEHGCTDGIAGIESVFNKFVRK